MRNLFISFLALFTCFYGFTQKTNNTDKFQYQVTYELTYQPDSTDTEFRKSEEMYLYIGDEISRFSSAGKAIGEAAKTNMERSNNRANYMRMRRQIPRTAFNYYLYKGIPRGKMTYTGEIIGDKYRYTENKDLFEWMILNETESILGFQAQKATTSFAGRDYEAWFTEELPFPEGPYKFNGLPGLIVKIADEKEHYVFEIKEILKLKQPIPLTFQEEEFTEITSKELSELQDEFKRDPIGFAKRALPGFNADYGTKADRDIAKRERKERLKKDNNPIELE